MRILITGGAGFVPSSLAEALLVKITGAQIVLVDNLLTGRKENIPLHPNCSFVKCDVNKYEDVAPVFISNNFDYVFHYAAVVGVKRTLDNPVMVLEDIQGIRNVLHLCKSTGVKRVFFSSSSEVYGEPVHLPQHEHTTPLNSRLPYAIVKNVGESFCRSYQQEYGLDYTIFRFFNTYGPKQSGDFVMTRFIKAALEGKKISVYGDGLQSRTFCYRNDNVDACAATLYKNLHLNDTVNIGSDFELTVLDLAKLIIKTTNSKSEIVHLPPLAEGDMTRRRPDITKMQALLGRPMTTIEDGIRKTIESGQYNY